MKYKIVYSDGETFDIETDKDLYEALLDYSNEIRFSWITAIIRIDW